MATLRDNAHCRNIFLVRCDICILVFELLYSYIFMTDPTHYITENKCINLNGKEFSADLLHVFMKVVFYKFKRNCVLVHIGHHAHFVSLKLASSRPEKALHYVNYVHYSQHINNYFMWINVLLDISMVTLSSKWQIYLMLRPCIACLKTICIMRY